MIPRERSYSLTIDERSPLLQYRPSINQENGTAIDHHEQFCKLVGVRPHTLSPDQTHSPHPQSLYSRATQRRRNQFYTYAFTATLTNGLLLSQVVLGAALTGLGASDSSRVLITIFGALNTVIAGVIAFLKSRGQPLRARMFRDDLDRVVDEIESSAVMWLGISSGVHGYDAIDTDEIVTVRSEVARLTRLYDRAVKANTANDPDLYAAEAQGDFHHTALRSRPGQPMLPAAPQVTDPPVQAPVVQPPVAIEPDESPATKAPSPSTTPKRAESPEPKPETNGNTSARAEPVEPTEALIDVPKSTGGSGTATPAPAPTEQSTTNGDKSVNNSAPTTPAVEKPDPDASPATAAHLPPRDDTKSEKVVEKGSKTTRLDDLRSSGSDAQAMSPFLNL